MHLISNHTLQTGSRDFGTREADKKGREKRSLFTSLLFTPVEKTESENRLLSELFKTSVTTFSLPYNYRSFILNNHFHYGFLQVGLELKPLEIPLYAPNKGSYRLIWTELRVVCEKDFRKYYHKDNLLFILTPTFQLSALYTYNYQGIQKKTDAIIPLKKREVFPLGKEYTIALCSIEEVTPHAFIELKNKEFIYSLGFTHQQKMEKVEEKKGWIFCPDPSSFCPEKVKIARKEYAVSGKTFTKAFSYLRNKTINARDGRIPFRAFHQNCTTFVAEFAQEIFQLSLPIQSPFLRGFSELALSLFCKKVSFPANQPDETNAAEYLATLCLASFFNAVDSFSNFGRFPWKVIIFGKCQIDNPKELVRWIKKNN